MTTDHNYTDEQQGIGKDVLIGAAAISMFIYGDYRHRRSIYYLAETGQLPVFRIGKRGLRARKSRLRHWVERQEDENLGNCRTEPSEPHPIRANVTAITSEAA